MIADAIPTKLLHSSDKRGLHSAISSLNKRSLSPTLFSSFLSASFRLDRFEMKFVITGEQRAALMPDIMPKLKADENAIEGAYYPIVSLYYDTADRACYWEKEQKYPSRRKMRVRVYGSLNGKLPPTCFIEVKHKCDGRGVKRRVRLPLEDCLRVSAGERVDGKFSIPDQRSIEEICKLVHERGFKPTMVMRYDRMAYADRNPESDLRVTFDTGIGYRMDNLIPVPDDRRFTQYMLPEGYSVMEVKVTGSVPYWLTKTVGEHHCVLQSHSKYSNALEDGDDVLHEMMGGRPVKHFYGITPHSLGTAATTDATRGTEGPIAAAS